MSCGGPIFLPQPDHTERPIVTTSPVAPAGFTDRHTSVGRPRGPQSEWWLSNGSDRPKPDVFVRSLGEGTDLIRRGHSDCVRLVVAPTHGPVDPIRNGLLRKL